MSSARPASLDDLLARTALRDQAAYQRVVSSDGGETVWVRAAYIEKTRARGGMSAGRVRELLYRAGDYRSDRAQPFTWMAAIVAIGRSTCFARRRSIRTSRMTRRWMRCNRTRWRRPTPQTRDAGLAPLPRNAAGRAQAGDCAVLLSRSCARRAREKPEGTLGHGEDVDT